MSDYQSTPIKRRVIGKVVYYFGGKRYSIGRKDLKPEMELSNNKANVYVDSILVDDDIPSRIKIELFSYDRDTYKPTTTIYPESAYVVWSYITKPRSEWPTGY
ncbi:hypothetical protein CPT_Mater28 [Bacillus phage Mater]|uniref:Uncharacterized protein n=1 Tax=Bacillus phage Mater TaxID=1540090 RepID=A0A0A0RMA1_9CAUD|nr:hypothetical protein CPT_Mater28 [Bacillus phage Mater]AIW03185.1 hypothetical protein CPT_Mater28 [Bacillus phage Mater]